jgi:hypothetical protein
MHLTLNSAPSVCCEEKYMHQNEAKFSFCDKNYCIFSLNFLCLLLLRSVTNIGSLQAEVQICCKKKNCPASCTIISHEE